MIPIFFRRFLVAYPCLVIGIGLIGYALGVIAESMLEGFNQRHKGKATMRFEDHLVLIRKVASSTSWPTVSQVGTCASSKWQHSTIPVACKLSAPSGTA